MTEPTPARGPADGSRPVTLVLPSPLRELTGGAAALPLGGEPATVRDALARLRADHPAVHARLVTEQGEVREHVNVFVGREHIRNTGGLDTPLEAGSRILVLPAVSGG